MDSREPVNISVVILRKSGKAVFVGDAACPHIFAWLPISQIEEDMSMHDPGDLVDITIPYWLAEEKEFI